MGIEVCVTYNTLKMIFTRSNKLLILIAFGAYFIFVFLYTVTYTLENSPSDGYAERKLNGHAKFNGYNTSGTNNKVLPWYFSNGTIRPNIASNKQSLLYVEGSGDRIIEQLMYVPDTYNAETAPMKRVSVYKGLESWAQLAGSKAFKMCPVAACTLIDDFAVNPKADAIVFQQPFFLFPSNRSLNQVWILYLLESALHSQTLVSNNNLFNWTATYRKDSDLVAPYAKWVYYDPQITGRSQKINYATNKTKKVAWLVSNCNTINNRNEYAKELQKHIPVDIYGLCGPLRCRRSECLNKLNDYKFYLSFENSNCRDYITEKFFRNALENNVVPIVLGARKEDYVRSAPKDSFIYAHDFDNPRDLARFLTKLDKDDDMYNSYFRWKGTGEFINTYFWCRLCALLHSPYSAKWYKDVNEWWAGPGVCDQRRHFLYL